MVFFLILGQAFHILINRNGGMHSWKHGFHSWIILVSHTKYVFSSKLPNLISHWLNVGSRKDYFVRLLRMKWDHHLDSGRNMSIKNLPAVQETGFWSLDWEDTLEKEMATHSSVLAWRIPGTEEPGGLLSMGSHRVRHDWSDLAAAGCLYLVIQSHCCCCC